MFGYEFSTFGITCFSIYTTSVLLYLLYLIYTKHNEKLGADHLLIFIPIFNIVIAGFMWLDSPRSIQFNLDRVHYTIYFLPVAMLGLLWVL